MDQPFKAALRSVYNLKIREMIILLILSCLLVDFGKSEYIQIKYHFSTLLLNWGFWLILVASVVLVKLMGYMIADSEKNRKAKKV